MKVQERLEFLKSSRDYEVNLEHNGYVVRPRNYSLVALIEPEGEVSYFVDGIYNSGSDWADIDVTELDKLRRFVELLTKEEE